MVTFYSIDLERGFFNLIKQNHKQRFFIYQGYNELDKHICHYFFSKRHVNLAWIDRVYD